MPQLNLPHFIVQKHTDDQRFDFLKNHQLSFFHYCRAYKNGSCVTFTPQARLLFDLLEWGFMSILSSHVTQAERSPVIYLWDEIFSPDFITLTQGQYKLYHGITLGKSCSSYYDFSSYAMPEERSDSVTYYLNIIRNLEIFSDNFVREEAPILKISKNQ